MGRLDGKVAIITGAAQCIGFATARLLCDYGCTAVIADLNLEKAAAAAAPAAVVQAHYSQDLEREADDFGASVLIRNHMSPELLAQVLRKLTKAHPGAAKGGYLASHPSTEERIRHLHVLSASHSNAAVDDPH